MSVPVYYDALRYVEPCRDQVSSVKCGQHDGHGALVLCDSCTLAYRTSELYLADKAEFFRTYRTGHRCAYPNCEEKITAEQAACSRCYCDQHECHGWPPS